MDDQKLLRRLRKGDAAALEAIVGKYAGYLYVIVNNVIRGQLGQEDAEELVSDAFLSLWNHRTELKLVSLRSYLAAIARNAAIDRLRARKLTLPMDDDVLQIADEKAGLEPAVLQRELDAAVRNAVEAMPQSDREIFMRYYFYYQKISEIAEAMGLNTSTVTTRLSRGRRKLKTYLAERGYCDG